jgi:hypothetical protein
MIKKNIQIPYKLRNKRDTAKNLVSNVPVINTSSPSANSWIDNYLSYDSANNKIDFSTSIKIQDLFIEGKVNHWITDVITVDDASLQLNAKQDGVRVNSGLIIYDNDTGSELSKLQYSTANQWQIDGNKIWHAGNDGSGSGLDADKLEGKSASAFFQRFGEIDADLNTLTQTGAYKIAGGSNIPGESHGQLLSVHGGSDTSFQIYAEYQNNHIFWRGDNGAPSSISSEWNKIWHSGNDGSGSGLDADKLDNLDSSQFLRSDASDTMNGNLTLTGYVMVGGSYPQIKFGDTADMIFKAGPNFRFRFDGSDKFDFTPSGRLGIGTLSPTEALVVSGNGLFSGNIKATGEGIFGSHLESINTSVSGFAGVGSGWKLDAASNHLTVDNLTVRNQMNVYELVINKIRATNGSLWVSDAIRAKCINIGSYYDFEFDDDNGNKPLPFIQNDTVMCQVFDGRNTFTAKGYVKLLSHFSSNQFAVQLHSGFSAFEVGKEYDLVRIGHYDNTDRQGSIYLTSSDNGSPYIDVLDGVQSSLDGKTRLRIGKLSGISGQNGYGIWGSRNGNDTDFVISSDGYAKIAGWNFDSGMLSSPNDKVRLYSYTSSILVFKPDGGRVSVGQTNNGNWTGKYGISATDSSNNYLFRLDDSANQIAEWNFDNKKLFKDLGAVTINIGVDTDSSAWSGFELRKDLDNRLNIHSNGTDFEVFTKVGGNNIFKLGSSSNQIAGVNFDNEKLYTSNWSLNKDGSANFANNKINFLADGSAKIAGVNFDNSRLWTTNWELKADGTATFTKGEIGGFTINETKLDNGRISLEDSMIRIRHSDTKSSVISFEQDLVPVGTISAKIGGISISTFLNNKVSIDKANIGQLILNPYKSDTISTNSSYPTTVSTTTYSSALVRNANGAGYITLTDGEDGQIFVVVAVDDSRPVYVSNVIPSGDWYQVSGGGVLQLMWVDNLYNSDKTGWFRIGYIDNNF